MSAMARSTNARARKEGPAEPQATVTPMELLVKELKADLDAIRAKIPNFQYPHPTTRKMVRTYRSVPREFVQRMNDTVRLNDEIRAVGIYNHEDGIKAADFVDHFKIFREEVAGFLHGLNFTIEYRHAEIAAKGLQTYQIIKALRRSPRSTLGSHLETLREALNRAGKKRGRKRQSEG